MEQKGIDGQTVSTEVTYPSELFSQEASCCRKEKSQDCFSVAPEYPRLLRAAFNLSPP